VPWSGAIHQIIKSTYGLNTGLARRLVVSILCSRILFGGIIWYNKKNDKSVAQTLESLYHWACRLITGFSDKPPYHLSEKAVAYKPRLKYNSATHTSISSVH
jgi:hypothetical protein